MADPRTGDGPGGSVYWRERADEARVKAGQLHDADARMTMENVADMYDAMANRAEDRERKRRPRS